MDSSPLEIRLQECIAAYLQELDAGRTPDRAEWLAAHPDLADELRAFFADHDKMTQAAAPVRAILEDDCRGTDSPACPAPAETFPQTFGDYELLEEIGRGGMGIVYKARQISLNRIVALKRIRAGQLASLEEVARFRREAQAAAGLDHPHIVPILEVGEHAGQHYFTMKLIEGGNLGGHLDKFADAKADLMIKIARAVHHAHQRGILHRDLKPGNILIDGDGQPHVSDFGLAQPIEKEAKLTQSGAIVGTAEYMAPEQARGEKGLTTAADVYGLGAILYVLLTGRPPFQGDYNWETLKKVVEDEPRSPRSLNRKANRDLETICLKCLAKLPAKRYGSAETLAEELQRWLDGKPIQARRAMVRERVWKWTKRRPAAAALVVVSVLSAVLLCGGGSVLLRQLQQALADATSQGKQLADQNKVLEDQAKQLHEKGTALTEKGTALTGALDQSRRHLFTSQLLRVDALYKADPMQALDLLHDYEVCPIDARDAAWRFLERSCQRKLQGTGLGHFEGAYDRMGTPTSDGKLCAAIRLHDSQKTAVMDLMSGEIQAALEGKVGGTLTSDGKTAWWFENDQLHLQDIKASKNRVVPIELVSKTKFKLKSIDFILLMSPDGKTLADCSLHGACLHSTDTGKKLREVLYANPFGGGGAFERAFSPDGRLFAVAGQIQDRGPGVLLVETGTGKVASFIRHPLPPEGARGYLRFSHDGNTLAFFLQPLAKPNLMEMCLIDVPGARIRTSVPLPKSTGFGLGEPRPVFSRDDRYLAWVNPFETVHVWDVRLGKEVRSFRHPPRRTRTLVFTQDGSSLVMGGTQGVTVWEWSGSKSQALSISKEVSWAAVVSENKLLVRTGNDLLTWNLDLPGHLSSFKAPGTAKELAGASTDGGFRTDPFNGVFWSPNSRYLALRARKEVQVIDVLTGKQRLKLTDTTNYPRFLPDGQRLACWHGETTKLWNLDTGVEIAWPQDLKLKDEGEWASSRFNLVGRLSAIFDGKSKLARIMKAGKELASISIEHPSHYFLLSEDGQRLFVRQTPPGTTESVVDLWDTSTGRRINRWQQEPSSEFLAFSPNLHSLVEFRRIGGTLQLLDLPTGRPRTILSSAGPTVVGASFSPDGALLATWDEAGTVRVWDLRAPLKHARFAYFNAAFSSDGARMVVSRDDPGRNGGKLPAFRLVDLTTGQSLATADDSKELLANLDRFSVLPPYVQDRKRARENEPYPWLLFSPDGKISVKVRLEFDPKVSEKVKNVVVSNVAGDKIIATLPGVESGWLPGDRSWFNSFGNPTPPAAISADGRWLAAQESYRHVLVASLTDGRRTATIKANARSLTFSPDNKVLAIGSYEGLRFFDPGSGKLLKQFATTVTESRVAFSADGKIVATGYGAVQLWDVASGELLASLPTQKGQPDSLAFSPDGRFLSAGYRYYEFGEVILWDLSQFLPKVRGVP